MRESPRVTAPQTRVESALADIRPALVIAVVVIPLACWLWVIAMARDMYGPMSGASAWMMTVEWDTPRLLLLSAMWAAMMAGMMLPTAAPILLLYARTIRNRPEAHHPAMRIYAMALGYVVVWAAFSVAATVLQRVLAQSQLLTPMMEPATPATGAALLLIAGVYQLTPFKAACLSACRSPIMWLTANWRGGVGGAFRMGLTHGLYCLGCCWAMMLLLFAGGVMNLAVILGLTAWVAVEKLAPFGRQSARVSGALLIAAGTWMLFR
jgi:predicted metal-binding membrane protein